MKKIIALLLTLILVFSVTACGANTNDDTEDGAEETVKINVGYMNGPTGMGMAKLIVDNGGIAGNEKYSFKKYTDTALAAADLLAGKVDVVCLPTNEAAKNFNTTNSNSTVLAINCLNSLFLLEKSSAEPISDFSELEGKTIYTCQKGTPGIILKKLIAEYDLDVTVKHEYTNKKGDTVVIDKPADIPPAIVSGSVDYVLAPEPIVTTALSKITSDAFDYSVALDLSDVWNSKFDGAIAMGCIVGNKEFVAENKASVEKFMNEYKASIEYVANAENVDTASEYLVSTTISDSAENAKSALLNLGENIAYLDGEEMKDTLEKIYAIFGMNVIGGKMPSDDFYYVD